VAFTRDSEARVVLSRVGEWVRRRREAPPEHGRRQADRTPNRGWTPVAAIALTVALLDWSTKARVASALPVGRMEVVWEGRVALWHVKNPAMVLGLFGDLPLGARQAIAGLLAVVGATLLLEVLTRSQRLLPHRRPWAWLFVGLVSGGMLGNLGERAVHWGITDFLSIGWCGLWLPPGNLADLAILASIPISLLVIAFELEARALRRRDARDGAEGLAAPRPLGG
jgi:lipoprotein signal peptidase